MKNFEKPKQLNSEEQDEQEVSESDIESQESLSESLLSVAQKLREDEKGELRFRIPVEELSEEQLHVQKEELSKFLKAKEKGRSQRTYVWAFGFFNLGIALGATGAYQDPVPALLVGSLFAGGAGIAALRHKLNANLLKKVKEEERLRN